MSDVDELLSDRVAAQGVRDLLDGKLAWPPLPGTLADRVEREIEAASNEGWRAGIDSTRS